MNQNLYNEKLFWSPSVNWKVENEQLRIEIFIYSKQFADIFPDFYFLTQDGIYENELKKHFQNIKTNQFNVFIQDLKKKRILVNSILNPPEVFFPQTKLLEHSYGNSLLIDSVKLEEFKQKQYEREYYKDSNEIVPLAERELPNSILNRRTCRNFDQTKILKFDDFSFLASTYRQIKYKQKTTYLYSSAGALYPIDVFYYIKKNRVENIEGGLYYYDPRFHHLKLIDNSFEIPKQAHYYTNQDIYLKSALSIYYFYNGEVSMPKYGGMGYYNSIIDLGIMIGIYTAMAGKIGVGVCSIGEMNFPIIEPHFRLQKNQVYLHTLEVGLK